MQWVPFWTNWGLPLSSIDNAQIDKLLSIWLRQAPRHTARMAKVLISMDKVQQAIREAKELFRNASYADKRDSTVIIREMRDS